MGYDFVCHLEERSLRRVKINLGDIFDDEALKLIAATKLKKKHDLLNADICEHLNGPYDILVLFLAFILTKMVPIQFIRLISTR